MKIAIILFNLGGPDSLKAVQPFLRNLFGDPAILSVPAFNRHTLDCKDQASASKAPAALPKRTRSSERSRWTVLGYELGDLTSPFCKTTEKQRVNNN